MSPKRKSTTKSSSKGTPKRVTTAKSKSKPRSSSKRNSSSKKPRSVERTSPESKVKESLIQDYVIPDAKFYQMLVVLMIVFNLLGLGVLIYNQYEGQLLESPPILTQIGGEGKYDKCLNYCEKYRTASDGVEGLRNDYTDWNKGFSVTTSESFEVDLNEEINALEFTAPGTECSTMVRMYFIDPRDMELEKWVITNYGDFEKQLMNELVLDSVAYKVFTRSATQSDKIFFGLGAEIVEISYTYEEGATCSYNNDDVYAQDFVDNLKELVRE